VLQRPRGTRPVKMGLHAGGRGDGGQESRTRAGHPVRQRSAYLILRRTVRPRLLVEARQEARRERRGDGWPAPRPTPAQRGSGTSPRRQA